MTLKHKRFTLKVEQLFNLYLFTPSDPACFNVDAPHTQYIYAYWV